VVARKKILVLFLQDMALRLLGVVFVAPCVWLVAGSSLGDHDDRRLEIGSDSHFVAEGHGAIEQHKARLVRREGDKPEEPPFFPVEPPDAGATHNVTCMSCSYPWISKDTETIKYCPVMIKDEARCGEGVDIGNETDVGNCSAKVLNAGGQFFMFGREGTERAFECRTAETGSDGACVAQGCCSQGMSENPNYDYYKIEPKSLRPLYNDLTKMPGMTGDKPVELDMTEVQETFQDQVHRDMMATDICGAEAASAARAQGCTEADIKEQQQKREQRMQKELEKQILKGKENDARIEKENQEFVQKRQEDIKRQQKMKNRNEGGEELTQK